MIWIVLILVLVAIFGVGELLEVALWTVVIAAAVVVLAFALARRALRG